MTVSPPPVPPKGPPQPPGQPMIGGGAPQFGGQAPMHPGQMPGMPQGQMPGVPPGMPPGMPPGGYAPLEAEDDGWGKIGLVMVALTVLFAGGVAYFIATGGEDEVETQAAAKVEAPADEAEAAAAADDEPAEVEPDEAEPTTVDDDSEPAAVAEDLVAAADDDAEEQDEPAEEETVDDDSMVRENGEIDRPAGLVSLSIESEPSGAQVIRKRDGVRLGVTPYRYEVEPSGGSISFVIKQEGYKSIVVKMPANQDGVRQVMLLPGKGGVDVPAADPEATKEFAAAKRAPTKSSKATPKKRVATKTKSTPKKATKKAPPKKKPAPKKKKRGTVDYAADPIPL